MATTTLARRNSPFSGILHALRRGFGAIFSFLIAIAEASERYRAFERLNSMSDAELAARGIKREDIVRRIFAHSAHI